MATQDDWFAAIAVTQAALSRGNPAEIQNALYALSGVYDDLTGTLDEPANMLPDMIALQKDARSRLGSVPTAVSGKGSMVQKDGLHLFGMTLPWVGVGLIATLMFAASQSAQRRRR